LYAIARDITDAKDALNELARAKDAADLANRELESFSYSVAHDLRAPLRSIDGFSLALLEDNAHQLDSEGKKFLALVRESAKHMGRLIDDLLRLSRITRSELHNETVDLSALAGAAIERLQRQEPARSVNIVIEHGLRTQGDMQLLAVVMENLLSNAWKFTGKRADARVEFGASVHDGMLAYFVRDNGAGFDMAFVSKLFRMFQRLHHAADYEGTGVGLVTVRRIIERHGGRVWAEARVDQGATIFFTLNGAGGMPAGGRASSRPQA
jgi:light-regulated signal transduction histidine kinase (bacteriophytochrome)